MTPTQRRLVDRTLVHVVIMKALDLIDNTDRRAWATGAAALSLLPGATMLAEIWTADE